MTLSEANLPEALSTDMKAPLWHRLEACDCFDLLPTLPEHCLDLIYIDPPYFTHRVFAGAARTPFPAASKWDDEKREQSVGMDGSCGPPGFDDRWLGGREAYLDFLAQRIRAMRRVLKPNGAFLLHLDWHIVHYAKVLCDDIFGDDSLQNELIWYYQTGGASGKRFSRKHDTILFYANGPDFYFDGRAVAVPRSPAAMKRAQNPLGARIAATDTHKNPEDVITIPALNPMARERTGYPTQKPVALLEMLITALCPPGGAVGDFFCGSGTTLVAAEKLRRRWIGCDIAPAAVRLAKERLESSAGP